MGFRISNIHAYDRFVAIDLGSYKIRSALYAIHDGKVELEGYASIRQNRKNIHNGTIMDMQGVAHTLEKAIHEACRGSDSIPEDIIIGFSPVVCIGDTISSQYIRHDPEEPLTMDELDMMIEKIEKSSLIRIKNRAKTEYAIIHDDIRLISSTLTSIMIDGKVITNPIGFTGQHIRITVLNIFTLASEYNILRSIVSSLGKNTISIVPTPLILPKIAEKSEYVYEENLFIDIGFTHMTVVCDKGNEIQYFETFATGAKMLIDIIADAFPKLSYTEIESLLMRAHPTANEEESRKELILEYFSYVIDALLSVVQRQNDSLKHKTIFVSGGIFTSKWIENIFFEKLEAGVGLSGNRLHLSSVTPSIGLPGEFLVTSGLSYLGQELLHIKKDPIIRILRYTLYHYE